MSKDDFRGAEFDYAPGSIHGLRSWHMDAFGRLTGVTHKEVWTPGENVSVCKVQRKERCPRVSFEQIRQWEDARYTLDIYREGPKLGPRPQRPIPCGKDPSCFDGYHTLEADHGFDPSCECGFWAYFEDGFTAHGDVIGVVEAYGRTTIGTRGFRAEKARIVAFSLKGLSLTKAARLSELYPDAAHYEDSAALVNAFPSLVSFEWEPVGENFWTKPVPYVKDEDSFANIYKRYIASAFTVPSSYFGVNP